MVRASNIIFIQFLLLLSITSGCIMFKGGFIDNQKRHDFYFDTYNDDTLILKNYILCAQLEKDSWFPRPDTLRLDRDSVFQHFVIATKANELNFIIDTLGTCVCDSVMYQSRARIKKLDERSIIDLACNEGENGKVFIVPFIYLYKTYRAHAYEGSAGVADGGGSVISPFNKLVVYIIKDCEIIYRKSIKQHPKAEVHVDPSAPDVLMTQEHWNTLVNMALNDYVKRQK